MIAILKGINIPVLKVRFFDCISELSSANYNHVRTETIRASTKELHMQEGDESFFSAEIVGRGMQSMIWKWLMHMRQKNFTSIPILSGWCTSDVVE